MQRRRIDRDRLRRKLGDISRLNGDSNSAHQGASISGLRIINRPKMTKIPLGHQTAGHTTRRYVVPAPVRWRGRATPKTLGTLARTDGRRAHHRRDLNQPRRADSR